MGVDTTPSIFTLEATAGIAYAQATNDPIVAHNDGTFIPPIYGVVPAWEKVFEVVADVVPEEYLFKVVHGEQDMIFHQPLRPGMELSTTARGESIAVKDSGTTLVVKTESVDSQSRPVLTQFFTMFYRGVNGEVEFGEPHNAGFDTSVFEQATSSEAISRISAHLDDDQTFRYAEASGDYMPIHLDDDFAKSVGLPGIIIHGLCTMAQASWAAISSLCNNDPSRLARIAVRFSKPLRPGDDITTSFFPAPINVADTPYFFVSTRNSDEQIILTNGLVEVRL
jgi:acyl dehydratase